MTAALPAAVRRVLGIALLAGAVWPGAAQAQINPPDFPGLPTLSGGPAAFPINPLRQTDPPDFPAPPGGPGGPPGFPGPPGGPGGPPGFPTNPVPIPIDGGLGLLALAGGAFAARRLRRRG